jgi:hypothetical protein
MQTDIATEYVTPFNKRSETIIFESLLTTFEWSVIFKAAAGEMGITATMVNFINVQRAACLPTDPKSAKKDSQVVSFLRLSDLQAQKLLIEH